jgi:hypothetical protein
MGTTHNALTVGGEATILAATLAFNYQYDEEFTDLEISFL